MKFHKTPLDGAYLIEMEKRGDERGFFARAYCEREFAAQGLTNHFVQVNNSWSKNKGTLRGLHYQLSPAAEVKLVRCLHGAIWDAIIDLRKNSATFGKWFGAEISEDNRLMMYVPQGFAHAFLTLTDNAEAFYFVSEFYAPDKERGIRWNDPKFGVEWPITPTEISAKDESWPDFQLCISP